jgi:hypothetical protein
MRITTPMGLHNGSAPGLQLPISTPTPMLASLTTPSTTARDSRSAQLTPQPNYVPYPPSIDRNERDQFATAEPATAVYRLTEAQLCPVDLGQQVQTRVRSAESGPLNAASGCGLHQLGGTRPMTREDRSYLIRACGRAPDCQFRPEAGHS